MALTFVHYPIPVIVEENKEGYLLYVESSGTFENDVWTICLCESGIVRHYLTNQVRIHKNATFGISKSSVDEYITNPRPGGNNESY
jgi:hypothetical protein